ncbi:MAG: DUF4091 domain-containing protein [Candidatus Omnitrophica bacterium]|nr:DUF4091 domain-containing protein [Candidatus Omnitrophota bacterium]
MFRKNFFIIITVLLAGILLGKFGATILKKTVHKLSSLSEFHAIKTDQRYFSLINPGGFKIYTSSSLDRIFQDGATLLKPAFSSSATISAARNEYESFQIVVQTDKLPVNNTALNVTDLINIKDGTKIDQSNISWRIVGFVPTSKPYYSVKYVGNWPDPLLEPKKIDIPAGTSQPFWVTVYVPLGTKAGIYKTTITVIADGLKSWGVPVTLHVYNFELPQQSQLKTAFDFYGFLTKKSYLQSENESDMAYKARIDDLNEKYIMMMLQYRMNPILNIDPSSQEDLGRVDRYLVHGLNNFAIGKKGGTFDNNWPKTDAEIEKLGSVYQGYGEDLKLNQMLPYAYIYTWDEGDMGNPLVAKITAMIHRAYPELKNMVCYHGLWNPDDFPNWGKDIDIWCFNIDNFDEAKMRRLQKMGMEMWMYVSGPSDNGSPNLAMDFDSIDYRILPWLCWKYNIKGLLYWCVNYLQNEDPFKNAQNTKWEQNANGLLFYPGPHGPLPSLRAEIFRDGMEDYEYIQLLFSDLKLMKEKGLDKHYSKFFNDSVRLLTIDPSIAQSIGHFTKDQNILQTRRDAIAKRIEEFNQIFPAP